MKKKFWWLFFLILIAAHFWYLDKFPPGMNHDELEYVLSAKSYFLTGADLSGSYFPKSIFQTQTEGIISFLPALLLSPYFGLVPLNQFTARLPYVLINLITTLILYFLVKKLFKNEVFAKLTAAVFLVNPWSFYLSRTATDTAFSMMFYLWGVLWCLDKSKKKHWGSLVIFILGFLSYHGAKVIFLPLILICLGYNFWIKKIRFKEGLKFLVISIVVMVAYFGIGGILGQSINQTRSEDIWILNNDLLSETVNAERRTMVENSFGKLFSNKLTVSVNIFFRKYLTAFSSEVMFISGDTRGTYRFGNHGLFYIVDFFLIFIGLLNLFKNKKKETSFLLCLILVSPLATGLSGVETSVINRSFLLLPVLIIFISFGVLNVCKIISSKINNVVVTILLLITGLILFLGFLCFYFFRFSIVGQENYFFSQKIIASYTNRNEGKKLVVIASEPREVFLEKIFYSQTNQSIILKKFIKTQDTNLENIFFTNSCPESFDSGTVYVIERTKEKCLSNNSKKLSISEEQFDGPLYYIINDSLCSNFELQPWLRFRLVENYSIEKLDDKDFCEKWIRQI